MRKLLTGLCAALLASASVSAFANTTTTHYSLNMPTVGADSNNWGNLSNANWSALDSLIYGIQTTANAACPMAGCTFTGGISGTTASFSSTLGVTGAATLSGGLSVSGATANGVVYADAGALSSSAGTSLDLGRFHFTATNNVNLRFFANRPSSGTDWTTAPVTIAELVDSTQEGFIVFSPAGNAGGIGFGSTGGTYTSMSSTGLWTFGAGLSVSGGTVTFPAGSIASAALANTAVTANSYGDATHVAQITVNAKGQLTNAAAVAIPSASTSTAGLVALATAAQAQTGTDTTHALTAASLGSNCAPASGYCIMPGGYIHEWGIASVGNGSNGTVFLPANCPTAITGAQVTTTIAGTNGAHVLSVTAGSPSSIVLRNDMGSTQSLFWAVDCY